MILGLLLALMPQRPQTTIILLDDVGHDALAAANTPNIDALAAQGTVFNNAWSMALCSPTRAALLTGRHGFRTGIGTLVFKDDSPSKDLYAEEVIIPEVLGVSNAAFGKWHLGQSPNHPNLTGFASYKGCRWNLQDYYLFTKTVNGSEFAETEYDTLNITNDVLNDQSTFRYVAFHAAHSPNTSPPGYQSGTQYENYLQQIEYMDAQIGLIVQNYTGYLFILGDNGTPDYHGGKKGSLFEGGINVPLIVVGPGVLVQQRNDLINVTDILATLATIYNVSESAEDSISFANVLFDGTPGNRTINFAEKFFPNHTLNMREVAIRNATHKLWIKSNGTETFYTMPGEVLIQPPYSGVDLIIYNRLKSKLEQHYEWN